MEATTDIKNAVLQATRRILEKNEGDISILFSQQFLYMGGGVILSYYDIGGGNIKAKYDYYGKVREILFNLESL